MQLYQKEGYHNACKVTSKYYSRYVLKYVVTYYFSAYQMGKAMTEFMWFHFRASKWDLDKEIQGSIPVKKNFGSTPHLFLTKRYYSQDFLSCIVQCCIFHIYTLVVYMAPSIWILTWYVISDFKKLNSSPFGLRFVSTLDDAFQFSLAFIIHSHYKSVMLYRSGRLRQLFSP